MCAEKQKADACKSAAAIAGRTGADREDGEIEIEQDTRGFDNAVDSSDGLGTLRERERATRLRKTIDRYLLFFTTHHTIHIYNRRPHTYTYPTHIQYYCYYYT
jgi:hypothetical protein